MSENNNEKKAAREMLTDADVQFLNALMESVGAQGTGSGFLRKSAMLFRVASDMLAISSELHAADVQIPWNSICWAAHLPQTLPELERTKDALAKILGPLRVDLTHPAPGGAWRAKYPQLRAVK